MTLQSETTARISAQRIINLTNPDLPSATSADTTRLGLACTDVESHFRTYLGRDFDSSNPEDVSIGVDGVLAVLMMRMASGGESASSAHESYITRLKDHRKRVIPKSSSKLTPTEEDRGTGNPVRPAFDLRNFDDFVPESPHGNNRRWRGFGSLE